ncbi:MAG: hypothetical protein LBQ59_04830 [Candidatus Peribacteria bacterium]|nr:hypothetical protein [Candidatus Peribacteria bacterium]
MIPLYEKENFLKSKDVTFLLDKSNNRLQIIEVLERFDSLKKDFLNVDKSRIQCRNIDINSVDKILNLTCDAYSQSYENN